MIYATIGAHEQRDVATTDIPGTFMQADMVGEVHIKLEGRLAKILAKLDLQLYTKYLQKSKQKSCYVSKIEKCIIWNTLRYFFGSI